MSNTFDIEFLPCLRQNYETFNSTKRKLNTECFLYYLLILNTFYNLLVVHAPIGMILIILHNKSRNSQAQFPKLHLYLKQWLEFLQNPRQKNPNLLSICKQ